MKNLLFAAPIALALVLPALPAYAGSSLDIGVGIGEPYPNYDPYPRHHRYPPPYDDRQDYQDQISCLEGRQIVRERYFRQIRPVKCEGRIYRYQAFKRGNAWLVSVNSFTAEIVNVRPLYRY